MNKYASIVALALAVSTLAACGPEPVPTDTVDQNQGVTRENSQLNAQRYKAAVYPNATQVVMQSDSTVNPQCRYGDGWASGNIIQDGRQVAKIKCQTNGTGKGTFGCMTQAEFDTKDYAAKDGRCDDTLTKLDKFK